jgi:hypothetical protein
LRKEMIVGYHLIAAFSVAEEAPMPQALSLYLDPVKLAAV